MTLEKCDHSSSTPLASMPYLTGALEVIIPCKWSGSHWPSKQADLSLKDRIDGWDGGEGEEGRGKREEDGN